jgi:hypothetical protein
MTDLQFFFYHNSEKVEDIPDTLDMGNAWAHGKLEKELGFDILHYEGELPVGIHHARLTTPDTYYLNPMVWIGWIDPETKQVKGYLVLPGDSDGSHDAMMKYAQAGAG